MTNFEEYVNEFHDSLDLKRKEAQELMGRIKERDDRRLISQLDLEKLRIQLAPGDWIWLSAKDHPHFIDKVQRIWRGPNKMLEVVGNNVYKIVDFEDEEKIVHGTRLFFLSGEKMAILKKFKLLNRIQWTRMEIDHVGD